MKRLLKADREVFEKHFITIESIFRKHNDGNLPKAEDVSVKCYLIYIYMHIGTALFFNSTNPPDVVC